MPPIGSEYCPHCGFSVADTKRAPFGCVVCSKCDAILWMLTLNGRVLFFEREQVAIVEQLFDRIARDEAFATLVSDPQRDVLEVMLRFSAVAEMFESMLGNEVQRQK